jgi:hypothetical protein
MKRLQQVFSLFMLQPILPFSRPPTGESRVLLYQPETLQGGWGFTDPSGPLFSMYLNRAERQGKDKKMTDRWKADADGIRIFVSGHITVWDRLALTARNDNDLHTRSTTVRMLKRIRNTYFALHEGINTTRSPLSKFCNVDPALNQASSYPLCNTDNHISTLTRLDDQAFPSPEVTAKTSEDIPPPPSTSCYSTPQSLAS